MIYLKLLFMYTHSFVNLIKYIFCNYQLTFNEIHDNEKDNFFQILNSIRSSIIT